MVQVPSQCFARNNLTVDNIAKNGSSPARSQRSASVDDRSAAVPFSVNESDLLCGGFNDYDSAHASIADWVDIFDQSRLGGGAISTSARAEVEGIEFELSEEQA